MTARILAALLLALPCALGAHLAGLLLAAFACATVALHLLPVLAPLALIGSVLFLTALIAKSLRSSGFVFARSYA